MSTDLPDPFEAAHEDVPGALALREARDLLVAGDAAGALDACTRARGAGVPAELVPHHALVHGLALLRLDRAAEATDVLREGWRDHPDFAALPAALGAAQFSEGAHRDAARTLFAAAVADDPDATLQGYRAPLGALVRLFSP